MKTIVKYMLKNVSHLPKHFRTRGCKKKNFEVGCSLLIATRIKHFAELVMWLFLVAKVNWKNMQLQPDGKSFVSKLLVKYPPEVDATQLQKILRGHWKYYLSEKPSLELCKSLIMLRDYNISGRINILDIPVLMHMLQFWRIAFQKFDRGHAGKTSSYNLRPLLWESGSTASNKVLECLVLRFAKSTVLTAECFVMAMVRLHLAHERYHSLDTKMKSNPISLEEMILMTIYS